MRILFIIIFLISDLISLGQTSFDVKAYGQKILNSKTKPEAGSKTFQVIDSLFCKNKNDKDLYLKVSTRIALNCDGALSEYICTTAAKFYFDHTSYFVEVSRTMTKDALDKWLNFVADDLYMENHEGLNGLLTIKAKIKKTESKLLNLTEEELALRVKYNDYIYKLAEKLVRAE